MPVPVPETAKAEEKTDFAAGFGRRHFTNAFSEVPVRQWCRADCRRSFIEWRGDGPRRIVEKVSYFTAEESPCRCCS
jgi:hypothetical protein